MYHFIQTGTKSRTSEARRFIHTAISSYNRLGDNDDYHHENSTHVSKMRKYQFAK